MNLATLQMKDWVSTVRQQAEHNFSALPNPSTKDENFRFTKIGDLNRQPAKAKDTGEIPFCFLKRSSEELGLLTFLNDALKVEEKLFTKRELIFDEMQSAVEKYPKLFAEKMSTDYFPKDKLAQLIKARWQNGVFIYIPKQKKIKLPLRVLQYFSQGSHFFQSIIVVGAGAELTLINELEGSEKQVEASFVTGLLQVHVGANATVRFAEFQNLAKNSQYFLRKYFELGRNARLHYLTANSGGDQGQSYTKVVCAEQGAEFVLHAGASGTKSQQFDLWMDVEHRVANTKSTIKTWTAMQDQSQGVFNATICIPKNAFGTEAQQKSHNLLLSDKAVIHAMPKLRIEADDVICQHGASISTVNPEQVHYLQTRGIPKEEAENMLIRAFMEPVVAKFPNKGLRSRIRQAFLGLVHE